jgi:hypothetical protein
LAESSWSRGTTFGIIAASAGAKNTVTVANTKFSRSRTVMLPPPATKIATSRDARRRFVTMRTHRRSKRST